MTCVGQSTSHLGPTLCLPQRNEQAVKLEWANVQDAIDDQRRRARNATPPGGSRLFGERWQPVAGRQLVGDPDCVQLKLGRIASQRFVVQAMGSSRQQVEHRPEGALGTCRQQHFCGAPGRRRRRQAAKGETEIVAQPELNFLKDWVEAESRRGFEVAVLNEPHRAQLGQALHVVHGFTLSRAVVRSTTRLSHFVGRFEQAPLKGGAGSRGPAVDVELAVDRPQVIVDRLGAEHQAIGDLGVG